MQTTTTTSPRTPRGLTSAGEDRLLRLYTAEVSRRGGETSIAADKRGRGPSLRMAEYRQRDRLVLLSVSGWRYYSRREPSRHVTIAYLCGRDDNGPWATRVPGTCTSVAQALAWLEPAEVHAAREVGRRVLRQGNVYAVQASRDCGDIGEPMIAVPAHTHGEATVCGELRATTRSADCAVCAATSEYRWILDHDGRRTRHRLHVATRALEHVAQAGRTAHLTIIVPFPTRFIAQKRLDGSRFRTSD